MNLHKKHDRFLTNGHSLEDERTDVVYSSRYDRNVAFANFNEPEWLAAADSTFLHFSLCGGAEIASRWEVSCDRRILQAYGLLTLDLASISCIES